MCQHSRICGCVQAGEPSPAEVALERARSHLRDSLLAPAPAEAVEEVHGVVPPQAAQIKDTTMGRLEHRLETVGQHVMSNAVSSYDAWIHGESRSNSIAPAQQNSVSLQPRT